MSQTNQNWAFKATGAANWTAFGLLAFCLVLPGCVRRRMTIRTNPPGAQVFIDDQEVGVTPVSTRFTYYGARNIRLVKDGYETLSVKQNFYPPWYEFPVLELFSETLWPFEKRDEQLVNFNLQPQQIVPPEKLLERAEGQRTASFQGHAAALPTSTMAPNIQLPPAEPILTPNQPIMIPNQPLVPSNNGVR